MKKTNKYIVLTVLLITSICQLEAQSIFNDDDIKNNRAYVRAGIDPATLLTLGYERKIGLPCGEKNLVTFAEWGFSVANLKNSELKVGGILPVFETGNFKIVNNLNLSAGTLTAKNFDSKKFAVADEVAFGIYKPKWFFTLTAEYEKIYLTHIEHSGFFRETYYEDAVDGWYKGAGGMFQFGIEGGRTFYDKVDVHLELKMPFTEKFKSYGGSPAHLNLGVGYRFLKKRIMNDISNTALVTLKCHIQEAKYTNPILNNQSSLKTYEYLERRLDEKGRKILNKKVKTNLVKHTILRAKKYDDFAFRFYKKIRKQLL